MNKQLTNYADQLVKLSIDIENKEITLEQLGHHLQQIVLSLANLVTSVKKQIAKKAIEKVKKQESIL